MDTPKCLVVFYSRTGTTRRLAEQIAGMLGCRTEEVADLQRRSGVLGFLKGGRHAFGKKLTRIGEVSTDPAAYGLVVIGTPVWAGTMTPAIRTYITQQKDRLPEVAFFLTTGGTGIERTFRHMQELCGKPPKATLGLRQKAILGEDVGDALRAFVEALRA